MPDFVIWTTVRIVKISFFYWSDVSSSSTPLLRCETVDEFSDNIAALGSFWHFCHQRNQKRIVTQLFSAEVVNHSIIPKTILTETVAEAGAKLNAWHYEKTPYFHLESKTKFDKMARKRCLNNARTHYILEKLYKTLYNESSFTGFASSQSKIVF